MLKWNVPQFHKWNEFAFYLDRMSHRMMMISGIDVKATKTIMNKESRQKKMKDGKNILMKHF